MKAQKWNYEKKKYIEYEVPKNASMLEIEMDTIISCAECGEPVLYGGSYTSRVIHNDVGLGWCVCEECHVKEVTKQFAYKKGV